MKVELADERGEPCACMTGEGGIPHVAGAPMEGAQVAAWLRQQLGPAAEICAYDDGRVSFAREPGARRTVVRGVSD